MNLRTPLALAATATLILAAGGCLAAGEPVIGLITKTETNPFFVEMKEGAAAAAKGKGAKLLSGACKADGDNAGQVTAMENMIAAGAKTILITPSDNKANIPAIKKARDKGVIIASVDGGCEGVKNVSAGLIAATSQQCPPKMASMGVEAGVECAKSGKKVAGYTDTGVTLIAAKPVAGIDSKDVKTGTDRCWGKK